MNRPLLDLSASAQVKISMVKMVPNRPPRRLTSMERLAIMTLSTPMAAAAPESHFPVTVVSAEIGEKVALDRLTKIHVLGLGKVA